MQYKTTEYTCTTVSIYNTTVYSVPVYYNVINSMIFLLYSEFELYLTQEELSLALLFLEPERQWKALLI